MNSPHRAITLGCSLALAVVAVPLLAADSPQFRGPDRDGIFDEEGLLGSWPDAGPSLLWTAEGLGESYASVAVAGDRLYTTGKYGDRGFALAYTRDGELLWKKEYGSEHAGGGYPGSRTTPTLAGDRIFLLSSEGEAVALDAASGEIAWKVDVLDKFNGPNIYFGVSESPLVLDDKVIVTPGGKDAAVVALDAATGATVWTTQGLSEKSAYCNPRLLEHGDHRQVVTFLEKHLVGIDPDTGSVLWRQSYPVEYGIHATSPLFHDDLIVVSHGYGQGSKAFRLAADGRSVSEVWTNDDLDVHHGGAVLYEGRIYGAASKKTWYVLDAATGEQLTAIPRLGKGAVVFADGRLYGYVESGDVHLVDPDPKSFRSVSSFEITRGEGHHWSHPVISDGVLYLRHGDVLMAYDVRAKGDGDAAP